ncbi:hypothetical protein N0V93_005351 [Gnomoniopsis smithogilvyi]|uniref:Uncharacterized protein n=1 Tax=Gnomoniopsis smithogilvyi TaxID=1191159 RepID=A0A9W9CY24_9PEZI|nr:hypothetical protein N0V93_005351 [Gnomoniopsis smithogilvyi]
MQSRNRPNRVVKTAPRRPNRRIDELAAQFGGHGNTGDEPHGLYQPTAPADDHDGAGTDEVMSDYKGDLEDHGDADADPEPDHGHNPHVDDAMDHSMAPMAPMTPNHHHHHHHHQHHHHQSIDDLTAPELLQGAGLYHAAAAAADLQSPSPPPPVGNTMPAPQPLVAATDFQPNPPPPQSQPPPPQFQPTSPPPVVAPPPPSPPQQQQHHVHHRHPSPPLEQSHKTTEQMAQESGWIAPLPKRMSRDPGQRLAEQRREGQELNLIRRSNVEALFAQIAGTEAANSCTHCKKGQGPWSKSQPPQPVATHPYAVPVSIPGPVVGTANDQAVGHVGSNAFVSPAQLQAAALWNASGAMFSHDAGVKGTVQSALLQVREATPYQRALIQVEVAAKQLALKIVEAEELAVGLGHGDGGEGGGIGQGDGEEVHEGHQNHHEYESPPGERS